VSQLLIPAMAAALAAVGIPFVQGEVPQQPAGAPDAASTAPVSVDTLTFENDANRMTVPVSIGAKGPYRFVIDTGAERSVVSRELAGSLNLALGRRVRVTTMTGQSELNTYMLPEVRAGSVMPATLEAPVVEARNLGAVGMLGLDALKGHTVLIDFDRNVMEVRPARKKGESSGGNADDIVIRAKNLYGQLIVTNAHYRGRKISVVIDTGSPITIGNSALLKRVKTEKSLGMVNLLSVTGQYLTADYRVIDTLDIAGIGFHSIPMAFADALPFKRFGLTDTPALMLGMDSLRLFRKVQIDFANREVRFTLPKSVLDAADRQPYQP